MKKLNQSGFAHWTTSILPLLVIAAIAVIGVKILTASHAMSVFNGKIISSSGKLYSPTLASVGQLTFTTPTSTQCDNGFQLQHIASFSYDGTQAASVCYDMVTKNYVNVVTFNSFTGGNLKTIAKVPTGNWYGSPKWQKAKVNGQNFKLAALEYSPTTPAHYMMALYDSVTGARSTVKVNGSEDFFKALPHPNFANNWYYDWSVDGRKILFAGVEYVYPPSNPMGAPTVKLGTCSVDITVAAPTMTCSPQVQMPGTYFEGLSWSHDSDQVAMTSSMQAPNKFTAANYSYILTARADLTNLKQLVKSPAGTAYSDSVLWSPDSTKLITSRYSVSVQPYNYTRQILSATTGTVTKQVSMGTNSESIVAWVMQ